ncbi:scavenger receptor cysteine-rich type 1 protein M130-like [Sardina pilchardus]|uniref:scavenger receptor cysteine-rich type 1 protein M130-like n=1 Tax=Sardina pilchardus TaxID=27697 RepID=UPI002E108104
MVRDGIKGCAEIKENQNGNKSTISCTEEIIKTVSTGVKLSRVNCWMAETPDGSLHSWRAVYEGSSASARVPRLSNGPNPCSGRVEVFHKEKWASVCNAAFDWQDAEVVCRELDCGAPVEVLGAAAFGEGEGQVWSEEIQCGGNETQIQLCPTSPMNHNCSHRMDTGLICGDAVRLVNGSSRCSGRVEVLHRGLWGTVCDNGWDLRDAAVVCRELGCGVAVEALKGAQFGQGSGDIWMSGVECVWSESTVKDCNSHRWGAENCGHHQDAGVICSGVQLGHSYCSWRVKLLHKETRHTLCNTTFDQQDAEVVCRQLDCGAPVEVLAAAAFGEGEGQVWSEEIQCGGNETHLCPTSHINHNCSHKHNVGFICKDTVRLVDGPSRCSGRVEVYHDGEWGTVCGAYWDNFDTAVVCKEVGCGDAVDSLRDAHFGEGAGRVLMAEVGCVGWETRLKNCSHKGLDEHTCQPKDNVGVICSEHRVPRLVNGFHQCSGRVEVEHGITWDTMCDDTFDWQDAEVVCRELDCGAPVEVLGAAAFGEGEGQVWSEEIQCGGSETQIHLCPTSPMNHRCSHAKDVGLLCSGYTDARLANGSDSCSGRVELKYLREWGTVCDASWDMRASSVLCHQLKCGSAVAVLGAEQFGEGSGSIWPDVFVCEGNETGLSRCGISSWRRAACSHRQDAGVICSGSSLSQYNGTMRLSGERRCEGAVEVYVSQKWRRVLLDSWSQSVSSVVCRQLACGSAVRFFGSTDTEGDGCVSGFHCSGRPQPVRLTGSGGDCAGRLEVLHNGSWGTVCDDSWDMQDAQVVCRQLQCGTALSAEVPASVPPGDLPIWLSEVNCTGDETSLWECPPAEWGRHDCSHKEDVHFMCSGFIQLKQTTDSRGPCNGVIDVYYNGTWGNICFNGMDRNTGSVICRQLGCGGLTVIIDATPTKAKQLIPPRYTGTGTNPHVIHKESVKECPVSPTLRLVGGPTRCSGRVEVLLQGEWGTVCDDSWDKRDAQVVCRQLDCGEPVREGGEQGSFGKGNGPIWLDEVNCTGHEHHLWECCRAPLNQSDCIHKEDAWVTCTGPPLPPTTPPPVTSGRTTTPPYEPAGLPVSPAAVATLGLLLLLLLGSLAVLLGQNRALRRALSKRQHVELIEAVYEELDHRLTTAGSSKGRHRARLQSDAENSWYEDVQEDERRPISVASLREPTVEYDDVAADENETNLDILLTGEAKREEYDDVEDDVTSVEKSSEVTDYIENAGYDDVGDSDVGLISESLREEGLEDYDDITTDENGIKMTKAVKDTHHANEKEQEYYDDIMNEDDLQMTSGVAGMMTADQDQEYGGIITDAVRLMNGGSRCSGRVEVYHAGEWGTVCDYKWGMTDAAVVCRELDCGDAVNALGGAHFGEGSGKIWMYDVGCEGSESTLKNCEHLGWTDWSKRGYPHYRDAGVICSETVSTGVKLSQVNCWTAATPDGSLHSWRAVYEGQCQCVWTTTQRCLHITTLELQEHLRCLAVQKLPTTINVEPKHRHAITSHAAILLDRSTC